MNFNPISQIKVSLAFDATHISVGRLALRNQIIYFAYDDNFLKHGIEISPFKCPLQPGVQTFDPFVFAGLPGVFYDSLPDGWGRLLLDRNMQSVGVLPKQLTQLDRLAHVGQNGMGALIYEPDYGEEDNPQTISLDQLADGAKEILQGNVSDVLQELLELNGSSAGARPKAMIGLNQQKNSIIHGTYDLDDDFEHWLVKFPNAIDGNDAGAIEYVYALMAKKAGIEISDSHLFPSTNGAGYFASKRFDRNNNRRLHMHSVCGLLHSDFRTPVLDYKELIALTLALTKDMREAEKMFRLAVFNVLAHNRDDHAKNFSFIMSCSGDWRLSPAYDLTFSSGPAGEQSTTAMGNGRNPSIADLVRLGEDAKFSNAIIVAIIEQTKSALNEWRKLAVEYGVTKENIKTIESKLSNSPPTIF
ncbi:MAG: type II toxin-antitoxin system HipA family toxin [Gammaproteobacteria bacterium]|nr:type II toxin-antitoxin system HipA family toxin [Gammaproteobacteria bacterium]